MKHSLLIKMKSVKVWGWSTLSKVEQHTLQMLILVTGKLVGMNAVRKPKEVRVSRKGRWPWVFAHLQPRSREFKAGQPRKERGDEMIKVHLKF